MNQVKIGKFIASKRKEQGLTQLQLAEKLGITDRAVSKWETGKSLPDASLMPELCKLLKITINDLLCGEVVSVENYNEKAEKALLEMVKKEEMQNKKLMMYENVIGFSSTLSFLIQVLVAVFFVKNTTAQILLFILAFAFLIVGVSFALKIEAETGYYECQKCHNKYVPKYSSVYFAMHLGTTRYMKCPKCGKKSWQKKVMSKE
ncbi:MAG: helix-turn-helix transcriptional regulator [Candidatus Fimenecus sp.]|nr:helix-turn-helix domain-containing protein [Ruminococcus sp.]MDY4908925.1 helix-turn-helix transcriptional regulator [Candidatus Fimenecus sp.]MDY6058922.1 helix-turn-helix transcriptional regulator [Candidatus Fimenecus sp.]